MARVRGYGRKTGGIGTGDVVNWYRSKLVGVEEGASEMSIDMAREGALKMRENIETRGTAKSGKKGRIETKKMRDAVDYDLPTERTDGKYQTRFGWIDPSTREDYFRYQEGGFKHNFSKTGEVVRGMYAMFDAARDVFDEFKRKGKGYIK